MRAMARDVHHLKAQIEQALSDRDGRIAVLIVQSMMSVMDLFDEQPPTILEALVSYTRDWHCSGKAPPHRAALRVALIEYSEQMLREARKRERRLYRGITGLDEPGPEEFEPS
jgi:hypothetical protein